MSLSNVLKQRKQELLQNYQKEKQHKEKESHIVQWLKDLEARIEKLEKNTKS